MDKITEFFASLQPWLSFGLAALAIVAIVLMIVFIVKFRKKKAYTMTLLNSIDLLDKRASALEVQVKTMSTKLTESESEVATLKSEKYTADEKLETATAELTMKDSEIASLNETATAELTMKDSEIASLKEDIAIRDEKLAASISLEEYNKVTEELEKNKKKSIKVDTLITKVEELTEKTKPVIKKVIKKEVAKLKKYSLEDLNAMYKHELMTLAQSLKLTGWTRYSKEKLAQFVYDNLPKNQKK